MKKCLQCGREYDNSMMFCLDDGAELLYGPASMNEPATAVFPKVGSISSDQPTRVNGTGNSIAVLPFSNISNDEENEYFCDGLAEELLNALAKIDDLRVAARTSAFSFKGKNENVGEIGRTLNVKTVLEGSVRKSGDKLRISVQLVNASDGFHLWSERYDREMKDIFDVQDEIALAVVDALRIELLGAQEAAVLKHHTRSPEALEFYLRGLSYFTRFTPEYFLKAIESFGQAIAVDPNYAEPYAGLAECYSEMSFFTAPGEWMPKAKEAARKAVDIDDSLGRAHSSLAIVTMYYDRDYAAAEIEFKRAIALDPGSAHIQMWYGWFLGLTRRFDEGLTQMKKARELDPLSPLNAFGIGGIYLWAHRPDEAIEQLRRVVDLHPEFPLGYQYLASAYLTRGDTAAAVSTIENAGIPLDDPFSLASAAYVYAIAGDESRARKIVGELERLEGERYELSVQIAQVYVGLGEADKALMWLEKAYEVHSVWPIWLGVDPAFDPLRSDPRYADLLERKHAKRFCD